MTAPSTSIHTMGRLVESMTTVLSSGGKLVELWAWAAIVIDSNSASSMNNLFIMNSQSICIEAAKIGTKNEITIISCAYMPYY